MTSHSLSALDLVNRAETLARAAHAGQFRRDGTTPYIGHPAAVVARVKGDALAEAVAWLHDVLEDTDTTEATLRQHQIPEDVITAVRLLTKTEGTDYDTYLIAVKANPLAKKVKVADMLSNLSDQPSQAQILKYAKGLTVLLS